MQCSSHLSGFTASFFQCCGVRYTQLILSFAYICLCRRLTAGGAGVRLPSPRTRQGNDHVCSCRALAPCLHGVSCLMASGTYRPVNDWAERNKTIGKHADSKRSSVSAIGDSALPSLTIQGIITDNTDRVQMPGLPIATGFSRYFSQQPANCVCSLRGGAVLQDQDWQRPEGHRHWRGL